MLNSIQIPQKTHLKCTISYQENTSPTNKSLNSVRNIFQSLWGRNLVFGEVDIYIQTRAT